LLRGHLETEGLYDRVEYPQGFMHVWLVEHDGAAVVRGLGQPDLDAPQSSRVAPDKNECRNERNDYESAHVGERRSSLAGSSQQCRRHWNKLNRLLPIQCSEKLCDRSVTCQMGFVFIIPKLNKWAWAIWQHTQDVRERAHNPMRQWRAVKAAKRSHSSMRDFVLCPDPKAQHIARQPNLLAVRLPR
jgi:hypothetical protein